MWSIISCGIVFIIACASRKIPFEEVSLNVPYPAWHLDHFYSNVSQRTNRMSSLFKMKSNRVCCLTCPCTAAVLTYPGLNASIGFPYVRQTTGTPQTSSHVNNIGRHAGNQAFDLKSLLCAGVGKWFTFICETALSTLATIVTIWWIVRLDHNLWRRL